MDMDKKYIEENEIEIKYLRNQLSEKELEEFEVYLMENPDAVDEAALEGLLLEHAGGYVSKEKARSSSLFSWGVPFKPLFAGLLPLVIVTALALNGVFVSNADLDVYAIRSQQSDLPSYNLSWAEQYLGFKSDLSVHVFVNPDGEFSKASVERFDIHKERYSAITTWSPVDIAKDGKVSLTIPLTKLKAGNYRVAVTEVLKDSEVERTTESKTRNWTFPFKVE